MERDRDTNTYYMFLGEESMIGDDTKSGVRKKAREEGEGEGGEGGRGRGGRGRGGGGHPDRGLP